MKMRAYLVCVAFLVAAATIAAQPAADPALKGTYQRIKVHGKSLEGNLSGDSADRDVSIYLPPGYSSNRRRYPVVYMLQMYDGDHLSGVARQLETKVFPFFANSLKFK